MISMRSFFSRTCHSPVPSRAAVTLVALIALAWSTPLAFSGEIHNAARDCDLERVKALLKDKPDLISSKDNNGLTPLHWAALKNCKDVVKVLLTSNDEVNAKDNDGWTPLYYAAGYRANDVTALLRANNAEVNAGDIEKIYLKSTDFQRKAVALSLLEIVLRAQREQTRGKDTVVFPEFQPDPKSTSLIICTLSPMAADMFKASFESQYDQIESRGMAGIYEIGNNSTFRFSGKIRFPFQPQKDQFNTPGFSIRGYVGYNNNSPSPTDSAVVMAKPAKDALIFEGETSDPLTFAFLQGIGLVYLHGTGSVTLKDGTKRSFPVTTPPGG